MAITRKKHKASRKNIKPPHQGILLKDRISELPPEILVDILSRLEMKEAGKTSILSRGWRYKWRQIPDLVFDGGQAMDELFTKNILIDGDNNQNMRCLEVERRKYIRCVDQVMRCHEGQTIEQFVLAFDLDKDAGSTIDNWVSFAIRKKVQRLKLDFRDYWRCTRGNRYSFPDSLEISRCKSLTSLHLAEVAITGEMLELLLYNCLDLESVIVRGSLTLVSLTVDGPPSLKLKWLELTLCRNIKSVNVSAPNLVSFKYCGPRIPMPLKDVPKLLELSITGYYSDYLYSHLSELSWYLSQLEKLTLGAFYERDTTASKFPVLPKLKHLTLFVATVSWKSYVDCASMINACPSLYKFSYEVWYDHFITEKQEFKAEAYPPHSDIRVVEFKGFRGLDFETGLAKYLIKNAVMLEKIIFDAVNPISKGKWLEFEETESRALARERAREVGKTVHPGVELVIA